MDGAWADGRGLGSEPCQGVMGTVPLLAAFSLLLALPAASWAQEVPAADPGTVRPNLLGGRRDLAVTDPEVQKLARDVVAKYNQASNSLYYFRPVKVLKAQSQLVAGVKYYLTVELGNTSCRKNQVLENHTDLTTCPFALGSDQEKLQCDFEVLVVPWKQEMHLLKQNCAPVSQ
ncbi:cystatin-M [Tachyglossus aculeatus]|uniref:cystatin-M n=1 Tax=Tachyglossus aculeatus TaxID=9261 RepID=UPI0018F76524|nr:cystatin-M [Tachyglossus aculeatus]